MDNMYKFATSGAVGAVAYQVLHGSKGSSVATPLGNVPIPVAGAVLGVIADVGSDIVNGFITPEISSGDRMKQFNSAVVDLGSAGGSFAIGQKLMNEALNEESGGLAMAVGVGAAVHLTSDYLWRNFVSALVGGDMNNNSF